MTLSVFLLLSLPLASAPTDFEGKIVGDVRFQPADQPLHRTEFEILVSIKKGQPLHLADVQATIQRLYSTGRYEDIQVDAEMCGAEVCITILTQQNWFISRITVEGVPEPPNRGTLASATKLELGSKYTEESIAVAIEGLRETLRGNGYYYPRIQTLVERFPAEDQFHISFLVDPGQRAYFARPLLSGNLQLDPDRIIGATNWKRWWGLLGWKPLTENRLQQGVDRVRRLYLKRDFLLADVNMKELRFDPDTFTSRPDLQIEAGPKVSVVTTGVDLSRGKLRDLVPIYQEQSIDEDLLNEGDRKITQYFQSQGYFDAKVTHSLSHPTPEQEIVEFQVDRGERFKVVRVEITGNRYFDTLTIRERMSVVPASLLRNRYGRFSEDLVERDRRAIEELYRSNGFRDVEVITRVQRNYQGREREVAVFLEIKENEQWFVNSLEISGVDLRIYPYLQSILTSTEGQPYSALNVATDRDNILNFYYDNGYPSATMEIYSTPAGNRPRMMDVRYVVTEGRRLYVRDVQVNGLRTTRPSLVFNRISLEPEMPLSLSSMVFSQRRLYDLGIFAKVDMALQNPEGFTRDKRVLFQMEEASRYSVNGGIGAEFGRFGGSTTSLASPAGGVAFAPRVSLGVSRLNFFGVGHTIGVQTRLSSLQKRGLLTYLAPQFQGSERLNLTMTGLYDDSRNVQTFTSRRFESAIQFGQRFSRAVSAQYRYTFRRVRLSDVKIDPEFIPLFSQPVRVGSFSATLINDRRDDPLDATRGIYYSADLAWANKAFASEAGFLRLLARNSSYHRIARDLVLSRNTTLGLIYSTSDRDIPLPERFYAGGAVSHRGFPENQAGPRDLTTGFPIGGKGLLFNQTELRFPVLGNNLGGVLFHDAGNVYTSVNDISLRFSQRNLQDFDYMVHAVGFGIRVRTPIGPLRFDLGFGLNSPRFFGYEGTIVDFPNNLGDRVNQRVSRIQFHFSLGQAF